MWQAIGSIAGAMIGAASQNNTNNQMLRYNNEMFDKQANFNAEQARLTREFQERMSQSEMSRRVADMRSAGLNPAFADSIGGAQVGASPTASASPVASPSLKAPLDALTASQVALNTAQADKLKADTEKTEKETDWMDVLNQNEVDYKDSCVVVNGSAASLNDKQKEHISQKIEESKQQIENLKKSVELMDSEITKNDIDSFWASGRYSAEIDALKAETHLKDAECKEILTLLLSKKALLDAQAKDALSHVEVNKSQARLNDTDSKYHFWLGRGAYWDAGSSRIHYNLYDKFGEADKWVDYAERGVNSLCKVGSLVMDYKSFGLAKRDVATRERSQAETARHNQKSEENEWIRDFDNHRDRTRQIDENIRHNRVSEEQRNNEHYENVRHNDASEKIHDFPAWRREMMRRYNYLH